MLQSPLEDELNALTVSGDDVTNTPEPGAENEIEIAARTDHKSDTDSGSAISEKSTKAELHQSLKTKFGGVLYTRPGK